MSAGHLFQFLQIRFTDCCIHDFSPPIAVLIFLISAFPRRNPGSRGDRAVSGPLNGIYTAPEGMAAGKRKRIPDLLSGYPVDGAGKD